MAKNRPTGHKGARYRVAMEHLPNDRLARLGRWLEVRRKNLDLIEMTLGEQDRKVPLEVPTCPHCGFKGRGSSMLRYHHDNCQWRGVVISGPTLKEI